MLKILTRSALASAAISVAWPAVAADLTAAHVNPPGEPSNVAFAALAEKLESSETGINLTVFPQGQVGGEKDAISQAQLGAITMTTISNSNLAAFAPSVSVLDIPYMFPEGGEQARQVVEGPIGEELAKKVEEEAGLEILGWWSAGLRHVFTKSTDVKTPADLAGLTMRVIGNPIYIDSYNAVGAKATPLPYGEVYTSLATGAIDAADNDLSGYRNMKFWEQAPHLSLTGMFFLFKPVVANKQVMDSLSEEQREEFDRAFAEVTDMQWDLFSDVMADNLDYLKEQGVTVTEPDRAAFQEAVQPIIESYSEQYGIQLVKQIQDAR